MDQHAYRAESRLCPGCGDPLMPLTVAEATVDRCDGCGGVWFDWFDGEVTSLARDLPQGERGSTPPPSSRGLCPVCRVPLHNEAFQSLGPAVLRCSACLGLFAPGPTLPALAALARDEAAEDSSCWARLLAALRGLLAPSK